jgi:hypothetical protein
MDERHRSQVHDNTGVTFMTISNGVSGLVTMRGHPGLNRGQSDLQSDALPLSYAPLL